MEAGAKGRLRISKYRLIARRARGCRVPAQIGLFWYLTPGVLVSRRWGRTRRHSRPLPSTMPRWRRCSFRLSSLWSHSSGERKKNKQKKTKAHVHYPSSKGGQRKERPPSARERRAGRESHGIKKKCQILCRKGGDARAISPCGKCVFLFVYCGLRKLKENGKMKLRS